MRYFVSTFCEGYSQTKLFGARKEIIFSDKYFQVCSTHVHSPRIDVGPTVWRLCEVFCSRYEKKRYLTDQSATFVYLWWWKVGSSQIHLVLIWRSWGGGTPSISHCLLLAPCSGITLGDAFVICSARVQTQVNTIQGKPCTISPARNQISIVVPKCV